MDRKKSHSKIHFNFIQEIPLKINGTKKSNSNNPLQYYEINPLKINDTKPLQFCERNPFNKDKKIKFQ